jgi:hypothetical protein
VLVGEAVTGDILLLGDTDGPTIELDGDAGLEALFVGACDELAVLVEVGTAREYEGVLEGDADWDAGRDGDGDGEEVRDPPAHCT